MFAFCESLYFVINNIFVIFIQGVNVGQSQNPVGAKQECFKAKSRNKANVDRSKKYEMYITIFNFVLSSI